MSEAPRTAAVRPSVMSLNINSKSALYAAYMPYLANGGIFVPTPKTYALGDEVFMLLQLMDDPTKHPVAGTVVWLTPQGAQGGKAAGIGLLAQALMSKQTSIKAILLLPNDSIVYIA